MKEFLSKNLHNLHEASAKKRNEARNSKVQKIAKSLASSAIKQYTKGRGSFAPRQLNMFPVPLSRPFVHDNFRVIQEATNQEIAEASPDFSLIIDPGIEGGLPVPSRAYITKNIKE